MAKQYGKNSRYLEGNDLKYYTLSALFPFAIVIFILVLIKFYQVLALPVLVGLVIIFFVLVKVFQPLARGWKKVAGQFYRGFEGEVEIAKMLKELPDTYSVFHGVMIGHNKGDIDFVVVGPPGVFLIEVKSHSGRIDFDGANLTLNGQIFRGKNLLRQVHGETWALKNFLQEKSGKDIYVHPVLVFTGKYASMHFGYRPVENIYVIQKEFLPGLFYNFQPFAYQAPKEQIEQILSQTV